MASNQPLANRQSEPGVAESARRGTIGLSKGLKDDAALFLANADARVANEEVKPGSTGHCRFHLGRYFDFRRLR